MKEDDKIDDDENEENKILTKEKATDQKHNETKDSHDKNITIIPKQLKQKHMLSVADTIISLIIIGPLVIGHWRGVWNLMDYYNIPISGWTCFLLGTGLHWIFAVLRGVLHGQFAVTWRSANPIGRGGYRGIRLLYTYIFCVCCNMQWRGGWIVLSSLMGENEWVVSAVIVILISLLIIFRSCRNLLAPPLIIVVDIPNHIFQFPTRYRTNTRDWTLYILDCAFSVGIVGTLVVFVWRGVWVLIDLHLFSDNREYSSIGSLIIGYMTVGVTFCLQPVMRYACGRLQGLPRLLAADVFLFLSFLGTINVWRGIWSMLDLWFLPKNVELSCWITHIGCFVFLGLLNCSNSILVRGVYIDAEEEEGRCVIFPCHYLRLFFKIEREKKEARQRNLVTISREYACNDGSSKDAEHGALLNCTLPTIISNQDGNVQG
ncbi:uncharacterized protein fusl isoform X2 [Chelonus insularis]|nr:uncharacterized protein LOC118070123 isoform X2 [Chelonus insularis]